MTHTAYSSAEGFDPLSPDFLEDPHVFWQTARQQPVFFYEPMQCWVLSGYDDIARALRNWQEFSSRTLQAIPLPAASRDNVAAGVREIPARLIDCAYINIDPPDHTVDRKYSQKGFTRPMVAAIEPWVRELANQRIDKFAADGSCDLLAEFCHPLSLGVIVRMVGLPDETLTQFSGWIDDFFGLLAPARDPEDGELPLPCTPEELEARYARVGEAYTFFQAFVEERRVRPTVDLISMMVSAKNDAGQPVMPHDHIVTHTLELAAAGSESTANFVAQMVRFFSAHPEVLQEIETDPSLWDNAVEEGLRRWAISNNVLRRATCDIDVQGVMIPKGSVVLLNIAGANSDDGRFVDPLAFDLHRDDVSDHLAFGVGRHFCLGAPLARMEAKSALQELYRRLPGLHVDADQEIAYNPAMNVRSLKSLQVSWDQ